MRITALQLLRVASCLWLLGLTSSFDRVVNRVFKLLPPFSNWTYSAEAGPECRDCHAAYKISDDGVLSIREYNGNWGHYVRVGAAHQLLPVNVSYSIVVTTAPLNRVEIRSVQIDLYTHLMPDDNATVRALPVLQQLRLSQILQIVIINFNQSFIDSKLSDIFISWKYVKTIPAWQSIIHIGTEAKTDVIANIYGSAKEKSRSKRQIFSNLHPPVFTGNPYTVSVREELNPGSQVVRVQATDADESNAGAVRYSLHADADQRSLNVFAIDSVSGWVTTKGRVDREDIALHKFSVQAEDQGSPSNSAQTMLTIIVEDFNDHAPSFELPVYNINVSETMTVGSTITRIRADDSDVGLNKVIVYSIANAAAVTDFAINRNTGDLSIARGLNRENVASYSFTVNAQDQADNVADRLSASVAVNILILDYNDNPPEFTRAEYTFRVREDIDVSLGPVVIGIISATDPDFGANRLIR